jgi:sugar/nucleoside kinase (ribokinase family)
MSSTKYVAIGSIIIDDIVYPDGRTSMAVLGGGGTHAAYGIALSGERTGLISLIGNDLPDHIRKRLEHDFDASGIVQADIRQLRGWQIFEWDGKRSEIFRVDVIEPYMYMPEPTDAIRDAFKGVTGVCLQRTSRYMQPWRMTFPDATFIWEPMRDVMMDGNYADFLAGIPYAEIVSPNLLEAQTVYQVEDEREIVRRMLADGVTVAALRMGEKGSLVAHKDQKTAYHIPPLAVDKITDQTGAGNTYCGAFLVGWCRSHDLITAGCYGAVASSFCLEYVGAAEIPPDLETEHAKRLQLARTAVRSVEL